jgi:ribosomal protein S18 acetylase RimI-like enzyme
MQIDILQAGSDDLETILQLQKECYQSEARIYNNYNIQPLQQDLKSLENEFTNGIVLKALINGELVGSVRGYTENGTAYIGKLMVKKAFQNIGIGRMLLESIESAFKDYSRFELFTGIKSHKNLYLYNRLGYNEFKRQVINDYLTLIYLEKNK